MLAQPVQLPISVLPAFTRTQLPPPPMTQTDIHNFKTKLVDTFVKYNQSLNKSLSTINTDVINSVAQHDTSNLLNGLPTQLPPLSPQAKKINKKKQTAKRLKKQPKPGALRYFCKKCTKKDYASTGNLKRHLEFECGVSPRFGCEICKSRFQHRHSLIIHHKSNHPETDPPKDAQPDPLHYTIDAASHTGIGFAPNKAVNSDEDDADMENGESGGARSNSMSPALLIDDNKGHNDTDKQMEVVTTDDYRADSPMEEDYNPHTIATAAVSVAEIRRNQLNEQLSFLVMQKARNDCNKAE